MFRTLFTYGSVGLGVLFTATTLMAAPGDIIQSFRSPSHFPTGMAYDGQNLWIADTKTDSLYAVDPTSGKVTKTLPAPSWRPRGLAWDGAELWVVDCDEDDNLISFDIHTGTKTRIIPSPVRKPTGLAWDGANLWVADESIIREVSPVDGKQLKTIPTPGPGTTGLAFDGSYLWVADRIHDRLYMVYPETGDVIMILDSPAPYPWGLAFVNGELYNIDYQTDRLYDLVADDGTTKAEYNVQKENVTFTHEVRNHGPGGLNSLDIYLAIPQTSDRQVFETEPLFFASVTPKYVTDKWGQAYAAFHYDNVKPDERITASYTVTADFYETRFFIRPEKVVRDIPDDVKDMYLGDGSMFNIRSPIVRKAVGQAVGSEDNQYWKARRIYNWLIDHSRYDLSGGWDSAPEVIKRGSGSCSEYSFAFVAMCRAAGIPARYVGAVAMRGDQASEDDVFHRWCEIYLAPYGWVPVDPSGGDSFSPAHRGIMFGALGNDYLITTTGSGSDIIGWGYNSGERWESDDDARVVSEALGQWTPAESPAAQAELCTKGGQYCRPENAQ